MTPEAWAEAYEAELLDRLGRELLTGPVSPPRPWNPPMTAPDARRVLHIALGLILSVMRDLHADGAALLSPPKSEPGRARLSRRNLPGDTPTVPQAERARGGRYTPG